MRKEYKKEQNYNTVESLDFSFIKPTEEQISYCNEWEKYFEEHRDINLEEKINCNDIFVNIYYPKKMFEKCSLDFEYSYIYNDSLDEQYGNTTLRHLFEDGYKFIEVNKNCNLYKTCEDLGNHIIHSPFCEFHNRNKAFLLVKDNKLFCILGRAYLSKKVNKEFYGYVGELGKKTFYQTTIFDYIKE